MTKVCFSIILLLTSFTISAQTIFQESFNGNDGTTSGTSNGVNWSSSCPTCLSGDHWEVQSGAFEGRDTNGEAIWMTNTPIDISSCGNFEVSFDIESVGTMEGCDTDCMSVDWVRFQYNIDGTGWVDPNNSYYCGGTCASINVVASDDVGNMNYATGCIPSSGNSLQLRIAVQCWASSEYWRIDNVTVNCGTPDAGSNGTLDVCASSNTTNLFDQLGGNPVSGGIWSGPSNLTGGDLGTFNPNTMTPGTYTYTVGNAPCQASANVVVSITDSDAGSNNSIEICPAATPFNLFEFLGGNPDDNGVWSGPVTLSGGHLGTFDPTSLSEGIYTFTYSLGNAPCDDQADVEIEISGPIASFTSNPNMGTTQNAEIEFINTSQNADSYIWDFGDNSANSFDLNPIHIFPNIEANSYLVTLMAFDDKNCSDTISAIINITEPEVTYEIPNIFTPNGDGENDFFKLINHDNILSLDIVILNRWGNVVFESKTVDFKWNGETKNSGSECSDGTYFYKLQFTDLGGNASEKKGFVQIAR
ncbi:T9SS type B sorting domain-containing protein [Brumimicrobium oceani]|uniref:T9SS type B sorting domain-containing protein n=1 Tax=Brumimicrobium oceani TaxID=2100725 RepID=UPI00130504D0|nr:gliding motility-associated C-terminal domain-containing protein [Brumimicrobium oceani]